MTLMSRNNGLTSRQSSGNLSALRTEVTAEEYGMTEVEEIEKIWRYYPAKEIEDFCMRTGQNIVRVLLRNAGPGESVKLVSKRLKADFYEPLVGDFSAYLDRLQVVLYEDQEEDCEFSELLKSHGCMYRTATNAPDIGRFLLIGDRASRRCVNTNPFRAKSCIDNVFIGKVLEDRFSKIVPFISPLDEKLPKKSA